MNELERIDPEVAALLAREHRRQNRIIQLIPSQTLAPQSVLRVQGSILSNLTVEGYPGRRYFPGCDVADQVENLAIARAKALFGAGHANVQPHSGVNANLAVYMAALSPGDTVLALSLRQGGHLSHGYGPSLPGRFYRFVPYGLDRFTERIDYDALHRLALRERPRLIVAGGSAYSRLLDFERFRAICDEVGARLMVDQAHIGGLVAAGLHPNPVPRADYVTGTTYKTLAGAKGGYILCRDVHAAAVDRALFPGVQGSFGPHGIAAKAVTFQMAMTEAFRALQERIVDNACWLASRFQDAGWRVVAGGTDTHLFLVDAGERGLSGRQAESALEAVGIYVNRNLIPFDERPPSLTSGFRVGTPVVSVRGFRRPEIDQLATAMLAVLERPGDEAVRRQVRAQVQDLCRRFPLCPA